MTTPIAHCLDRLNLGDNVKVRQRAEQYQGQLSDVPNKIFDKGPNLKTVICIQLANESFKNYDWDIKLAAGLSGCTKSAYESVLSIVRQKLNLQTCITMDMLAVALGSTTMLTQANKLWNEFTASYTNKLTGVKKTNAQKELNQSCWKGAIMYTCAKALGITLQKNQVQKLCECSTAELNKSIKVIKETCDTYINQMKNDSTATGRSSRKRTLGDEEGVEKEIIEKELPRKKTKTNKIEPPKSKIKPISGIVSMINQQDYKNTRRFAEYKQWKSNLIRTLSTKT